jgi:ribose transport system substrate-binding protein
MKEKHPNVKIVSVQYGAGDQLKSTEIAKSILQANPNLKGMFGANEGSIIGVLNGAKETKRKGVRVSALPCRRPPDCSLSFAILRGPKRS